MTSSSPSSTGSKGKPGDDALFASVESPDLVDLVEAQLTRAIVDGKLPPGARIVEADIARRMGISRAPVREAARRLERQGVLVARPRHGFAVRTISVQEIDDLYEVRISIELTSIELACRKADDAGMARVKALLDRMMRPDASTPQDERIATDLELHMLICELAGNARLLRIFTDTQMEMRMIIALINAVDDSAAVAATHGVIVAALLRRDADAAKHAMRVHLEYAWEHVRALFVEQHGTDPVQPRRRIELGALA